MTICKGLRKYHLHSYDCCAHWHTYWKSAEPHFSGWVSSTFVFHGQSLLASTAITEHTLFQCSCVVVHQVDQNNVLWVVIAVCVNTYTLYYTLAHGIVHGCCSVHWIFCHAVNYIQSTLVVHGQLYGSENFPNLVWSDVHCNSNTATQTCVLKLTIPNFQCNCAAA